VQLTGNKAAHIIDQNIQTAKVTVKPLAQAIDVLFMGHIGLKGLDLGGLSLDLIQTGSGTGSNRHLITLLYKAHGGGQANAFAGARNKYTGLLRHDRTPFLLAV